MSQESEANTSLSGFGKWQGEGLSGPGLDQFVQEQVAEIKALWVEETQKDQSSLLGVQSYRKVVDKAGYYATHVTKTCLQMVQSGTQQEQELGGNILFCHYLHSVFAAIDLLKTRYPGMVDEEDLFTHGLIAVDERIHPSDSPRIYPLTTQIHQAVCNRGGQLIAEQYDFSIQEGGIDILPLLSMSQFMESEWAEKGTLPAVQELATIFDLSDETAEQFIERWKLGNEKYPVASSEVKACDLEEGYFTLLCQNVGDDYDLLADVENKMLREELESKLDDLTARERRVIELRFGLVGKGKTLEEVGKEFGCNRERIRQIESKALKRLRHRSRYINLKDYFGETCEEVIDDQILLNGAVNAVYQKDWERAQANLAKVLEGILKAEMKRNREGKPWTKSERDFLNKYIRGEEVVITDFKEINLASVSRVLDDPLIREIKRISSQIGY